MIYIANAFSLGMVPRDMLARVRIEACDAPDVGLCTSCVGHADTAVMLGVPMQRVSIVLAPGDVLYVAQLQGGRLPEGCTTLPEGVRFDFIKVQILLNV
jgi:hypothetical protein